MRPQAIDICICTFRRPALADAIRSVARQAIPPDVSVRIVVIDNDDTPTARSMVQAEADLAQTELVYVHAPGRNISVARNAALEVSQARFLVFLDDDEITEPGWLIALWTTYAQEGAEVVLGPVDPVYPQDAPEWMEHASIHATRPVYVGGEIRTGYTCNVLIDRYRADLRALRFDPGLGRSGGEDSDFFARAMMMGARIVYAPDALVTEIVQPDRLSFGWLAKRRYRMGVTHAGVMVRRYHVAPWRAVPVALAKLLACACLSLAYAAHRGRRRGAVLRGVLHAGVVAGLMGLRGPVLYGGVANDAVEQ